MVAMWLVATPGKMKNNCFPDVFKQVLGLSFEGHCQLTAIVAKGEIDSSWLWSKPISGAGGCLGTALGGVYLMGKPGHCAQKQGELVLWQNQQSVSSKYFQCFKKPTRNRPFTNFQAIEAMNVSNFLSLSEIMSVQFGNTAYLLLTSCSASWRMRREVNCWHTPFNNADSF